MVSKRTAQNRLNKDLRKAIHSGDGYEDYITVYQFLKQKQALVTERMRLMRHRIDDFYDEGGEATMDRDRNLTLSLNGVVMHVYVDGDGEISGYDLNGIRGKREVVQRLLSLFFCLHMLPIYGSIVQTTVEQLADMDNDNVLRGMTEIRDIIRGDKYLTVSSLLGTDIRTENDIDPFGLFTEEEE